MASSSSSKSKPEPRGFTIRVLDISLFCKEVVFWDLKVKTTEKLFSSKKSLKDPISEDNGLKLRWSIDKEWYIPLPIVKSTIFLGLKPVKKMSSNMGKLVSKIAISIGAQELTLEATESKLMFARDLDEISSIKSINMTYQVIGDALIEDQLLKDDPESLKLAISALTRKRTAPSSELLVPLFTRVAKWLDGDIITFPRHKKIFEAAFQHILEKRWILPFDLLTCLFDISTPFRPFEMSRRTEFSIICCTYAQKLRSKITIEVKRKLLAFYFDGLTAAPNSSLCLAIQDIILVYADETEILNHEGLLLTLFDSLEVSHPVLARLSAKSRPKLLELGGEDFLTAIYQDNRLKSLEPRRVAWRLCLLCGWAFTPFSAAFFQIIMKSRDKTLRIAALGDVDPFLQTKRIPAALLGQFVQILLESAINMTQEDPDVELISPTLSLLEQHLAKVVVNHPVAIDMCLLSKRANWPLIEVLMDSYCNMWKNWIEAHSMEEKARDADSFRCHLGDAVAMPLPDMVEVGKLESDIDVFSRLALLVKSPFFATVIASPLKPTECRCPRALSWLKTLHALWDYFPPLKMEMEARQPDLANLVFEGASLPSCDRINKY